MFHGIYLTAQRLIVQGKIEKWSSPTFDMRCLCECKGIKEKSEADCNLFPYI